MPEWLVSRFSLVGLAVVILQQIPGIVWALHPPKDDPFSRNSGTPLVEALEKGFGIASLLMLVVVPLRGSILPNLSGASALAALVVLGAYYAFYVAYFLGVTSWPILLGMAAFPPMAYLLAALSQGNYLALASTTVFGVVHVSLTYSNLGPKARGDAQGS
jgi:hypothetical protein